MTEKEAYKIGFMLRCAEEGLTPVQTELRVKQASTMTKESQEGIGTGFIRGAAATASKGLMATLKSLGMLTIVAPPIIGATGGYMLANAKNDTFDIDEAKKDEELAEYYRAMDMLGRSQRNRVAA
jgi:hypothetical protein